MRKNLLQKNSDFHFFESGQKPKLLIHTGTHGDEYEVINIVTECLKNYESRLPAFIFVPQVPPSAVAAKSRFNHRSTDINRIFYENSDDLEVQWNLQVLKKGPFDLFVSFHEDPESTDYYLYDSGRSKIESELIKTHNQKIKKQSIGLLNGLDDPSDPALGYAFIEGYKKFVHKEGGSDNGMIIVWAINHHRVNNCLIPEIPGKLELKKKEFIIDTFFSDVIIRYFN